MHARPQQCSALPPQLEHQCPRYLNNALERDHGHLKHRLRLMRGFIVHNLGGRSQLWPCSRVKVPETILTPDLWCLAEPASGDGIVTLDTGNRASSMGRLPAALALGQISDSLSIRLQQTARLNRPLELP